MWEINQQEKMTTLPLPSCFAFLVWPSRYPGGKSNCLAVSIIYQHGNIMVLIITFERPVLSPQLCTENFLIGGNLFSKNKTVITESWWGKRGCRYRTFCEGKCITYRVGDGNSRALAEGNIQREVAAWKRPHRRELGAATGWKRGCWRTGLEATIPQRGHAFT